MIHHAWFFSIWPTPRKGYDAVALFNIQQDIRRRCRDSQPPIALIGHSTDSAGFSLSLAKWVMTPQQCLVDRGIVYLGLGIRQEQYLAPYFWSYPTIMYLDFDHNQRSCLRNLKYPTRDLTMFRDKSGSGSVIVSITHLIQLRITCAQRQISTNLTELDLVQLKFCDQNSDAGYKIFCDRMVSLLDMFVPGSRGTQLFITAISAVMEPARNVKFGSPVDVVRSVAKGLFMLRLWKRYLLLQGLPLDAKPGAAKEPSKRGCFISA